jgi:hypothetical protein
VVEVVGRDQVTTVEAFIGVFLVTAGAGLLASAWDIGVEKESIVPSMISLVAGQRVLESDRRLAESSPARR